MASGARRLTGEEAGGPVGGSLSGGLEDTLHGGEDGCSSIALASPDWEDRCLRTEKILCRRAFRGPTKDLTVQDPAEDMTWVMRRGREDGVTVGRFEADPVADVVIGMVEL